MHTHTHIIYALMHTGSEQKSKKNFDLYVFIDKIIYWTMWMEWRWQTKSICTNNFHPDHKQYTYYAYIYFILTLKTKCSSTIFPSAQICSGHLSKLKILIVFAPNFFSLLFARVLGVFLQFHGDYRHKYKNMCISVSKTLHPHFSWLGSYSYKTYVYMYTNCTSSTNKLLDNEKGWVHVPGTVCQLFSAALKS